MPLETVELQLIDQYYPRSLTHIRTQVTCQREPEDFKGALDVTTLRQLFPCSSLCCVNIRVMDICSFDLNDSDLMEMAAPWPHLDELVLNRRNGWRRAPATTFRGLAYLLRACPRLHTLSLSMDATQLNFTPIGLVPNNKIQMLDLGNSIIEEPAAVARILGDIFGPLFRVYAWQMQTSDRREDRSRYAPLWAKVNSYLRKGLGNTRPYLPL
ncbi:hypothetical protein BJ138DRAFT_1093854 [Hygrophoropsis aurantiaca]|uniref:Uncharacterized protein n=1 Tax=Hygrophoropsis aurantiaca TaxID=72124 RepID=A0ACB8A0T5_9AGAM|nr:hypothetical protein BJ138DRAFT_1093854 [Hygrophoropsis aurantiaca]